MSIFQIIYDNFFCKYKKEEWYKELVEEEEREAKEEREFQKYGKNINKINKIMRDKVKKIVKFIHNENQKLNYPLIYKILIFGSSTRKDCTEESDIDICLYTNYKENSIELLRVGGYIQQVADINCDVFFEYLVNQNFLKKIEKDGVIVYGN